MADTSDNQALLNRRQLLQQLGVTGAKYTAPTVIALLSANNSFAHGMGNPTSYASRMECKADAAAMHTTMSMAGQHCRNKHGI